MARAWVSTGIVLALLAGCDNTSERLTSLQQRTSAVTSLTFTASTSIPSNPAPAVNLTVTDAARAQAAFKATLALPVYPPGEYHCPADWGVLYHLTFFDGKAVVLHADISPTGCGQANLNDVGTLRITPAYWPTLAPALGVAETQIYPYPLR